MTIDEWLKQAAALLADSMIPSARLDAEIILAHSINRPRTWLHAHGDATIDPRRRDIADARIALRRERVPVAYIIGHKDFYGRRFFVSPAVLIPRPDSEVLIDLLGAWLRSHSARHLVDVGTGSGCLGITAKLEYPELSVTLIDNDSAALKVARQNQAAHHADVKILNSQLLDAYPLTADIIMANLPYVDRSWQMSADTRHEPSQALFAGDAGLELIKQLIDQASRQLAPSGAMIVEADPRQHQAIIDYGDRVGLRFVEARDFGLLLVHRSL